MPVRGTRPNRHPRPVPSVRPNSPSVWRQAFTLCHLLTPRPRAHSWIDMMLAMHSPQPTGFANVGVNPPALNFPIHSQFAVGLFGADGLASGWAGGRAGAAVGRAADRTVAEQRRWGGGGGAAAVGSGGGGAATAGSDSGQWRCVAAAAGGSGVKRGLFCRCSRRSGTRVAGICMQTAPPAGALRTDWPRLVARMSARSHATRPHLPRRPHGAANRPPAASAVAARHPAAARGASATKAVVHAWGLRLVRCLMRPTPRHAAPQPPPRLVCCPRC